MSEAVSSHRYIVSLPIVFNHLMFFPLLNVCMNNREEAR